jgi:ribosomal protein S19E (S16A)
MADSMKLTEREWSALEQCATMFRANIGHTIGMDLEDAGLVKWHPGSGYVITESGRSLLASNGKED